MPTFKVGRFHSYKTPDPQHSPYQEDSPPHRWIQEIKSDRLWVIGASDPEIDMIVSILNDSKEVYAFACKDGKRCSKDNAYESDSLQWSDGSVGPTWDWNDREWDSNARTLAVECDASFEIDLNMTDVIQLISRTDPHIPTVYEHLGPDKFLEASTIGQVLQYIKPQPESRMNVIKLVAAAQHFPEAGLRGECPGVDPVQLQKWIYRMERRKAKQLTN